MSNYASSRTRNEDRLNKGMPKKKFYVRRKVCRFCEDKEQRINYKDSKLLTYFITERGKIIPRRISGNCAFHQRRICDAIKRARNISLLPFTVAHA
jgi:small subunit ribosomal protein S18